MPRHQIWNQASKASIDVNSPKIKIGVICHFSAPSKNQIKQIQIQFSKNVSAYQMHRFDFISQIWNYLANHVLGTCGTCGTCSACGTCGTISTCVSSLRWTVYGVPTNWGALSFTSITLKYNISFLPLNS